MSSSRCLRSAFEACRPSTVCDVITGHSMNTNTIQTSRLQFRISIQQRTYADKPVSDIKGVPKPESTPNKQPVAKSLPKNNPTTRAAPTVTTSPSTTPQPQPSSSSSVEVQPFTTPAEGEQAETPKPVRPIPANVLAAYRSPLKHPAPHGVPVASLQLRSYSVRNLEFFSDFALRAAYYLNLPASGPVPLPKKIERWTMPRANFVHKKSQENFERITYKRLITIMDGHQSAVEVWLSVLRKWQFYGVGMKANVWEWAGVDVASQMDAQAKDLEKEIEAKLANFGWNKNVASRRSIADTLQRRGVKSVAVPMMDIREEARSRTLGELAAAKAAKA